MFKNCEKKYQINNKNKKITVKVKIIECFMIFIL